MIVAIATVKRAPPLIHPLEFQMKMNRRNKAEISEESVSLPSLQKLGSGKRPSVQVSRIPPFKKDSKLPPLPKRIAYEPIVVNFVKNGNLFSEGVKVNIRQRSMRNWENLLSELSRKMDLPAGVRHIYTPENGHRIKSLSQLHHKRTYVCGSLGPFKKMDYRNVKNPDWSRPRVSEIETESIFSNSPLSPSNHPSFTRSFKNLDARVRSWTEVSSDGSTKSSRRLSHKPKKKHHMSIAESKLTMESPKDLGHTLKSLPDTTSNPKCLALSIYRNVIKSWEEAKQLISKNLRATNGYLHLYKLDGEEVESLSQLWTAGTNLIATEEEEFHLSDFLMGPRACRELDQRSSGNDTLPSCTSSKTTKSPSDLTSSFPKRIFSRRAPLSMIMECKLEERLTSVTKSELEVGGKLKPSGLLNCAVKHRHVGSDFILGEKTYQPEQKSEEEAVSIDGIVEGDEGKKDIDTSIKAARDANTSTMEGKKEVRPVGCCSADGNDVSGQGNLYLSNSELVDKEKRDLAISSSDASKQYFTSPLHQTISHFHPQSHQTSTSIELTSLEISVSSKIVLLRKQLNMDLTLQEIQNGNRLRPMSDSRSFADSSQLHSKNGIMPSRGSLSSSPIPSVQPHTPVNDVCLGVMQSVDMVLLREERSGSSQVSTMSVKKSNNVVIQTNSVVDDHLSTTMEPEQLSETEYTKRKKALSLQHAKVQLDPKQVDVDALVAIAQLHKQVREKYQIGMVIEEGSFASIKFCTNKQKNMNYLLRVIQKGRVFGKDDEILQEIKIMRMMRHENVMTVLDYWETSTEYCMVMEHIEGGDLYDAILYCQYFSETDAMSATRQLGLALVYLHANRIVHRGIKPENIFLSMESNGTWNVKLAGFCQATTVTEPLTLICGNENYRAPEMTSGKGYSTKADVWSAGIISYILLSGVMPFENPKINVSLKLSFPKCYWENTSSEAKQFIQCLLKISPSERYSSSQFLQHPWFKTHVLEDLHLSRTLTAHLVTQAMEKVAPVLNLTETALNPFHSSKHQRYKSN